MKSTIELKAGYAWAICTRCWYEKNKKLAVDSASSDVTANRLDCGPRPDKPCEGKAQKSHRPCDASCASQPLHEKPEEACQTKGDQRAKPPKR
jgi:hypothetical protein